MARSFDQAAAGIMEAPHSGRAIEKDLAVTRRVTTGVQVPTWTSAITARLIRPLDRAKQFNGYTTTCFNFRRADDEGSGDIGRLSSLCYWRQFNCVRI